MQDGLIGIGKVERELRKIEGLWASSRRMFPWLSKGCLWRERAKLTEFAAPIPPMKRSRRRRRIERTD